MVWQAIRQRTSSSIRWALLESMGCAALGAFSLLLLARLLEPEDFGMVALVLALVTLAEFWVTAPFSESLIQRRSLQPLHLDSAFWAMLGFGLVACVLCVSVSGLIADFYSKPLLRDLIRVYSFSLVLTGLNGLPAIMLQRELSFRALSKRTLAGRAVGVFAAGVLALLDFGVWSIVIGELTGKAVATVTLWSGYHRQPAFRFSLSHLADLLRFGWITTVEWLLWNVASRTFIAGLGYFHGVTALGYLNLAMRITDTINQLLNSVSQRFFLPVFSALQHDRPRLMRVVTKSSGALLAVTAPTFLGVAAIAPAAVELIFGSRWLPAVPLIWVLCIFWVVSGSVATISPYLKSIGKPLSLVLPALVAAIFSLSVAVGAAKLTLLVALACFSARILVNASILLYIAREIGGIRIEEYLMSICMPLLAASVMALNVWGISSALHFSNSWANLSACVAVGVVLYGTLLCALDKRTANWLWTFLRSSAQSQPSPSKSANRPALSLADNASDGYCAHL